MATPRGRKDPPLADTLSEEPYRFEFFQAVRLLGRLHPGRQPVGGIGPARDEVVRFRSLVSLAFPPSELYALEPGSAEGAPAEMTVAFLGLAGPVGVLPQHYTESLLARRRAGDRTAAAFFDLFNHRMISLFFRAWEKYRPPLSRERGEEDRLAGYLYALMGLATAGLRGRNDFPDAALLAHAARFAQRRRPAIELEALLADSFGVPVRVEQFAGRWLPLDASDRSAMGREGPHNGLGTSLMLGSRAWDVRGKFRLRIGPLGLDRFLAFGPDGDELRALSQMARMFVDAELDFDVQVSLKAEEVPACRLSSAPGAGARLGRHAWLKSLPFAADADNAIFPARA